MQWVNKRCGKRIGDARNGDGEAERIHGNTHGMVRDSERGRVVPLSRRKPQPTSLPNKYADMGGSTGSWEGALEGGGIERNMQPTPQGDGYVKSEVHVNLGIKSPTTRRERKGGVVRHKVRFVTTGIYDSRIYLPSKA